MVRQIYEKLDKFLKKLYHFIIYLYRLYYLYSGAKKDD